MIYYYVLSPNSTSFQKYKKIFIHTKYKNKIFIEDSDKVWLESNHNTQIIKPSNTVYNDIEFTWIKKKSVKV